MSRYCLDTVAYSEGFVASTGVQIASRHSQPDPVVRRVDQIPRATTYSARIAVVVTFFAPKSNRLPNPQRKIRAKESVGIYLTLPRKVDLNSGKPLAK